MIRNNDRSLALFGLGLAVLGASCALPFWSLSVDQGSGGTSGSGSASSTSTSTGLSGSPDGDPCSGDDDCLDKHCLPSNQGSGNVCCALDCSDNGAASCFTNGKCDATGLSCALYPTGTFCGPPACKGGMQTGNQCQGGACGPGVPIPCPGGLICDDPMTCKTTCKTSFDCRAQGATCPINGNAFCVAAPPGTPCGSDDECMYQCGTNGTGHCCSTSCIPSGGACGATDCDTAGNCIFPDTTTACGATSSCSGIDLMSQYCDGLGGCANGSVEKPCAGDFSCATPDSCYTNCSSNDQSGDAQCAPKHFCNGQKCVPGEVDGLPCARPTQCASGQCLFICYG